MNEEIKAENNSITGDQMECLSRKYFLTVNETAYLFGIGRNKLRDMIRDNEYTSDWIVMNGSRHLIRRKKFEAFLDEQSVI